MSKDRLHGTSIRVIVSRVGVDRVRVAVTDLDHTVPAIGMPTDDQERGRGLALVAAVSQNWGVVVLPWGKRVWAELAV